MQKNVLVAGASGSLGFEVIKKLKQKGVHVKALVKSQDSVQKVNPYAAEVIVADARKPENLDHVFDDADVVFSAVGQSVSLFSNGGSFEEIDYGINKNLVEGAVKAGV